MQNWDRVEGYNILGANLGSILSGFGSFTLIASKILLDENLGTNDGSGMVKFEPTTWYSLPRFLRAFDRIGREFGDYILRQVGASVPRSAVFPPEVRDIYSALQSVNIAYHMNHGRNGRALFLPETGEMTGGIGQYGYKRIEGKKQIVSDCTGLYPCAFDQSLLLAMAQRFEPSATLTHGPNSCRSRGGSVCSYTISWR